MNTGLNSADAQRAALLEKTRELVPMLRARGLEISEARRVPEDIMKALADAGLMQLMRPKEYGGPDLGADLIFAITRELARGDGSTAWVYAVTNAHDHFVGFFPKEVQDRYWASEKPLLASSYIPTGKATPTEGGYVLSGSWPFSSGIDNCDWVVVGGFVGALPSGAPDLRFFMAHKSDYTIKDDWSVMGLCGTGSKSVVFNDVFVPNAYMISNDDIQNGTTPGGQILENNLYRTSAWPLFGFCITGPAVGIVQGAYEVVMEGFRAKVAKPDPMFEARKPASLMHVAAVTARIDAAAMLYDRGLKETSDLIVAGKPLPLELRTRSRRDQTYGLTILKEAMETLMGMSGGSGIYETGHVQRAFRDLHSLCAHPGGSWDSTALGYGNVLFGGRPVEPFI